MAAEIIKHWAAQLPQTPAIQSALNDFSHYAFKRAESWRWTPSQALFTPRSLSFADYEFSFSDTIADDFTQVEQAEVWVKALSDVPFAHLNVALLEKAFVMDIPAEYDDEQVNTIGIEVSEGLAQFSRVVVKAGEGSKSALWINVKLAPHAAAFPVIYLELSEKAELDVVLWIDGDSEAVQSALVCAKQADHSILRVNVAQMTVGAFSRIDVRNDMQGEEAEFYLGGVQSPAGNTILDLHAGLRHSQVGGKSHQILRGVVDESAFAQFDGMIYVDSIAQKTDAQQDSRYILLSENARSQSVPRLEIYADDVQCAHGSTAGNLDEDALFYLRSRGIDLEVAQKVLLLSFLHEAVVVEHEALSMNLRHAINISWTGEQEDEVDYHSSEESEAEE